MRKRIEQRLGASTLAADPVAAALDALPPHVSQTWFDKPLIPAAVLVPLVTRGDDISLLLTQRTAHLKDHPGQISFPGGRTEPGDAGAYITAGTVFVEDPELKAFVSKSIPGGHQFFHKAPCVIIMLSDARDYRYPDDRVIPFVDGSSAAQNIYLMCETMGLGCCWGSYFSFGSVVNEREIRRRLRIPESHLIVASLAVGKSEQYICPIPRDDPGDRMHQDFYSAK